MLAQSHRFHGRRSTTLAYKNSVAYRAGLITLRVSKSSPETPYRVAVVVSKKVHKSAVIRNRIRRRVYELCRTRLYDDANQDLLFIAHDANLATMSAEKLQHMFLKLCKDAKLPLRADNERKGRGIVDKKEKLDVS